MAATKKLKLVFIGNSITNGFPHKRSQSFPSLIREATGHEVINKGANGETTAGIMQRFQHDVLAQKPDLVYIMTGTNDFLCGLADPQDCMTALLTLCECSRSVGAAPVLLTPVPVWPEIARNGWMAGAGICYADIQKQLDEFSGLILASGAEEGITTIDIGGAFREFIDAVGPEAAYQDGVHPSVIGQRCIADTILLTIPPLH